MWTTRNVAIREAAAEEAVAGYQHTPSSHLTDFTLDTPCLCLPFPEIPLQFSDKDCQAVGAEDGGRCVPHMKTPLLPHALWGVLTLGK